jgi:hypothetical protein
VERDVPGVEDEAVLMSVQPVLTCGIIGEAGHYSHAREKAAIANRRVER